MSNSVIVIAGLIIIATLMLASFIARTFRKAGPNEAIIIYGIRGPRERDEEGVGHQAQDAAPGEPPVPCRPAASPRFQARHGF